MSLFLHSKTFFLCTSFLYISNVKRVIQKGRYVEGINRKERETEGERKGMKQGRDAAECSLTVHSSSSLNQVPSNNNAKILKIQ